MRNQLLILLVCAVGVLNAEEVPPTPNTAVMSDTILGDTVGSAVPADGVGVRSPWTAAGLSLLAPGAGQFYNRRYVRGFLYMATEVSLTLYARNRLLTAEKHTPAIEQLDQRYRHLVDSLGGIDTSAFIYSYVPVYDSSGALIEDTMAISDSIPGPVAYRMSADTARYKRDRLRYSGYQATWWAASCYIYALMDALEKTGRFSDDEPRNPKEAFWLSLGPGLGLGQIYNGKLSKAGLIFMVQSSLGYMSYNYHRLMLRCEDQLLRIDNPGTPEHRVSTELPGAGYRREWDSMRKHAFRNRNTYLWYSIFFYFYSVFDAVVDAHLHDYDRRMELEPDLRVTEPGLGMRVQVKF